MNPTADYIHWELTPSHVIFDICDAHAEHDEGLGVGNYPPLNLPLPHPWCTCLYYPGTDRSLAEIARDLQGWADGERQDTKLDAAFSEWKLDRGIDSTGRGGILKSTLGTAQERARKAAQNAYEILDAKGDIYHYAEGTRLQDREVFAGYGAKEPLREETVEGLVKEHGGSPEKWAHVKAYGWIDDHGEDVRAEIHWFEEETVGQVKHRIKRWLDLK